MALNNNDKLDLILTKLDSLETQIGSISKDLTTLNNTVTTLKTSVESNTSEIAELKARMDKHDKEMLLLKSSHHKREQRLRSNTIRLFNFPYTLGESLENFKSLTSKVYDRVIKPTLVAAKAAGDLGSVPQQSTVIENCFRAYRKEEEPSNRSPPPVLIRLAGPNFKFAIMKNRRVIPPPSDGERKAGLRSFVLVEDLTPEAHSLLRALQQDSRTEKVWSVNGTIHFSKPGVSGYRKVRSVFDSVDSILAE